MYTIKVTNPTKFNDLDVDLSITHVSSKGILSGKVTIIHPDGKEKTFSGEHAAIDFEDEYGFIIEDVPTAQELIDFCEHRKGLHSTIVSTGANELVDLGWDFQTDYEDFKKAAEEGFSVPYSPDELASYETFIHESLVYLSIHKDGQTTYALTSYDADMPAVFEPTGDDDQTLRDVADNLLLFQTNAN